MPITELRCTFGGRSVVPDVAVFTWERIPCDDNGKVFNSFLIPPDWTIEILSPDQSQTKVVRNILHCLAHGSQMGWQLTQKKNWYLSILLIAPALTRQFTPWLSLEQPTIASLSLTLLTPGG